MPAEWLPRDRHSAEKRRRRLLQLSTAIAVVALAVHEYNYLTTPRTVSESTFVIVGGDPGDGAVAELICDTAVEMGDEHNMPVDKTVCEKTLDTLSPGPGDTVRLVATYAWMTNPGDGYLGFYPRGVKIDKNP